jgi:hypothetical protein
MKTEMTMKNKMVAVVAAALLAVASASAQQRPIPCTVTIASGSSASPVMALGGGKGCEPLSAAGIGAMTQTVAGTILSITPPAALDATTAALLVDACNTTGCMPLSDTSGTDVSTWTIVGGATPTRSIYVVPATAVAFAPWFTITTVTSAGVAVTQTATRTFTVLVRPF